MPIYKAPNNDTYRLDSAEQIDQLPAGCVEIDEAELASIIASRLAPDDPPSPAAQIDALERLHMLPRPVRDVMLGLMEKEAAAVGLTPAQLRVANPGYRRVKELDEQIAALRALL